MLIALFFNILFYFWPEILKINSFNPFEPLIVVNNEHNL